MSTSDMDLIDERDVASPMVAGFTAYWRGKAPDGGIPARESMPPEELKPWFGHIQIVEVIDGGADFRHRLVGTGITEIVGRDLTGKLVSECEYAIGTERMLERYRDTLTRRSLVFRSGRIVWAKNREWIGFEMVTAPLADADGAVIQLLSVLSFDR